MDVTVLLVDDEPRSLERLTRLVKKIGARARIARDPYAAMECFVRERPVLTIVHDVVSEDRGLELCRDMKTLATGRNRAVVVLTARRAGHRAAARRAGCDAFVGKPFTDRAVLRATRRFLAEGAP